MERNLEIIRDERRFPYKTISDIVRHAVYRHLLWMHAMEPGMPRHFLAGLEAVLEVTRDSESRTRIQETFGQMDKMIEGHMAAGDTEEALRLMSLAKQRITLMPESRWRTNWLGMFRTKYSPHLHRAGTGTNGTGDDGADVGDMGNVLKMPQK